MDNNSRSLNAWIAEITAMIDAKPQNSVPRARNPAYVTEGLDLSQNLKKDHLEGL